MAVWFQIGLVVNLVCWAVFFYLLSRRRWSVGGLAVSVFHMLFAGVLSVAPVRALLDPDYVGYGLGVLQFEKRAVALPAALVLAWALASAWAAVGKGRGRWMRVVMVGDLFLAVSIGVGFLLGDSRDWKFQLGEHFTADGVAGLLILICLFTLPFASSAIWAARRTRDDRMAPPPAPSYAQERREKTDEDGGDTNGFRYSAGRA
jgi:hypothetical protein